MQDEITHFVEVANNFRTEIFEKISFEWAGRSYISKVLHRYNTISHVYHDELDKTIKQLGIKHERIAFVIQHAVRLTYGFSHKNIAMVTLGIPKLPIYVRDLLDKEYVSLEIFNKDVEDTKLKYARLKEMGLV